MKCSVLLLCFLALSAPAFSQARKAQPAGSSRPFVLGVTETLPSAALGESRTLNIYLPEGYSPADTTRYPVIYLLDGSADEDFIHVAGLVQFCSFPWVDRLPKTIVVGIANTDRKRDFTYPSSLPEDRKLVPTSGGSSRFMDFLEKELQPYIERKYATNGTRTLIGESLGGLLAAEILWKRPGLFSKYIIISPSLWWDNGSLLRQSPAVLEGSFTQSTDIYIGVGKEGVMPGPNPHVMEVDANLLADKIQSANRPNLTVHFDYLPQEDHATIAHQALYNAFRLLHPRKNAGK